MDACDSTHRLPADSPGVAAVGGQGFPRAQRLRRPSEFKHTFATGVRTGCGPFLAVTAVRCGDADAAPRLGLAIAKRHAAKAVERNRIKRQLREDFRRRKMTLPPLDCVICLRGPTRSLPNHELRVALNELWQRVTKKCDTSSSS